jgi:hypothetical protein
VQLWCAVRMIAGEIVINHKIFRLHAMNFQTLDPSEYGAQSHIKLTICKSISIHHQSTSLKQLMRLSYCMPTHCLLPFPNATRYFSKYRAFSGSSHLVGSKLYGSGKMDALRCIIQEDIPTTACEDIKLVHVPELLSSVDIHPAG